MYAVMIEPLPDGENYGKTVSHRLKALRTVLKNAGRPHGLAGAQEILSSPENRTIAMFKDPDAAEAAVIALRDAGFFYDPEPDDRDAELVPLAFITNTLVDAEELDEVELDEQAYRLGMVALALTGEASRSLTLLASLSQELEDPSELEAASAAIRDVFVREQA